MWGQRLGECGNEALPVFDLLGRIVPGLVVLTAACRPIRGVAEVRPERNAGAVGEGRESLQPLEVIVAPLGLVVIPSEASPPDRYPQLLEQRKVAGDVGE